MEKLREKKDDLIRAIERQRLLIEQLDMEQLDVKETEKDLPQFEEKFNLLQKELEQLKEELRQLRLSNNNLFIVSEMLSASSSRQPGGAAARPVVGSSSMDRVTTFLTRASSPSSLVLASVWLSGIASNSRCRARCSSDPRLAADTPVTVSPSGSALNRRRAKARKGHCD